MKIFSLILKALEWLRNRRGEQLRQLEADLAKAKTLSEQYAQAYRNGLTRAANLERELEDAKTKADGYRQQANEARRRVQRLEADLADAQDEIQRLNPDAVWDAPLRSASANPTGSGSQN